MPPPPERHPSIIPPADRGNKRYTVLRRIIKDLKKYFFFSIVSAKSQLKTEVANSYLNWVWWILEPFCFMLIYVFVYGYIFQAREANFPVFIFLGITLWDFFNRTVQISVRLVRNNKGIVSKIYMPKYILLLTKIWVNGFKMLVSLGIVAVMIGYYHIPLTWNVLYLLPILGTLMLLAFGTGTLLMHFGVYLDDLTNLVNISTRLLFYVTGIFYSVSTRVPAPHGEILSKANPIAFLLESARNVLLYGEAPEIKLLLAWFAAGCLLSYVGIQVIYKNENNYVKAL